MMLTGFVLVYLLVMGGVGTLILKRMPYPYNVVGLLLCSGLTLSLFFYLFPIMKGQLG